MIENIGTRLYKLRKASGLTQEEIAREIGFSNKFVSTVENNKQMPGILFISRICFEFGISIDSLVYDNDKKFQELIDEIKELCE